MNIEAVAPRGVARPATVVGRPSVKCLGGLGRSVDCVGRTCCDILKLVPLHSIMLKWDRKADLKMGQHSTIGTTFDYVKFIAAGAGVDYHTR